MGFKRYNEPVEILALRFRFFPRAFRWRGGCYEIDAVESCRTRAWPRSRRFFRVQCTAGTFELCQDLAVGTWHVRRIRWARAWIAGPVWRVPAANEGEVMKDGRGIVMV